MTSPIIRHGKTWLFHLGVSVTIMLAFAIAGNPIYGAWAAAGGYTFREVQGVLNEGRPTADQWTDHLGDVMGAYLVLLVTWIVVK